MSEHIFMGVVMTVLSLPFVGIGVLVFVTGASNIRSYVAMTTSDPIPVRDVADTEGVVEFEGKARRKEGGNTGVRAPFSGEECLACSYCVREKTETRPGAKDDRYTLKETGEVVVGATEPKLRLTPRERRSNSVMKIPFSV